MSSRPILHLALLVATFVSTFITFALTFGGGATTTGSVVMGSLIFSTTLLLILGSHEMGHYVLARIHNVDTSLPYFIPLPLLGVGTLGAVIRIRSRIPHRNALVDIGAAGPIAGIVVAIPVLCYGFAHSVLVDMPAVDLPFPGEHSLWVLIPELIRYLSAFAQQVAPAVSESPNFLHWRFGDSLLMLVLQHVVMGPIPEGKEVLAHPAVMAGWFGCLVTMLNLIPIGQLDGGHLSFAIFGKRAQWLGRAMALWLFSLCLFYTVAWLLWLVLTVKIIGFKHPEVIAPEMPLTPLRRWICGLCLLVFIVSVMPIPLSMVAIP